MFQKILIANRGEIALRILRACRLVGVPAVVAYSEADRDSLPVQLADEAICIGPADARRSYLSAPALISAAIVTGADAIHPGYGFLSEDEGFADAVRAHGLTFIGPPAQVLERFASKERTRRLLAGHGLPTIPGSNGMLRDDAHALEEAERIGYPVLVKPSAGGGGKGMRMVRSPRELESALKVCRSEARSAFGDDSLYLEKWLETNRHVEVQVAVDRYGHGVHMGERDCSVQRRHQKIIEEAPTPALSPAARADLCERALGAVVAAGYENLGTLEFLVDADGNFYFIEINCRVQVEHPVTEMLTGIDMVALQIRIAAGEPLGFSQDDVVARGHAIEFRINAEDAAHDFRPQAGVVERFLAPGGPCVRMDTHLYPGYEVPPYYDSLLGKLIVWGPDRATAIARARVALDELLIEGLVTNVPIHRALLLNEQFLAGRFTTNLIDRLGSAAFLAAAGGGGGGGAAVAGSGAAMGSGVATGSGVASSGAASSGAAGSTAEVAG
ncbi:MAG: acetyl-CoA carboxylase biotin carboxylase subunit [Chloroflexota bacterium]